MDAVANLEAIALRQLPSIPELRLTSGCRLQLERLKISICSCTLLNLLSNTRFVSLSDDAELAIGPVGSIPFFYGDHVLLVTFYSAARG